MSARGLRNARVRGINGFAGAAVSRALTDEFFHTTFRTSRRRPRLVRLYGGGLIQAYYDDKLHEWSVVGRMWESPTASARRVLHAVARKIAGRNPGMSLGDALDRAAEAIAQSYAERDRRTAAKTSRKRGARRMKAGRRALAYA